MITRLILIIILFSSYSFGQEQTVAFRFQAKIQQNDSLKLNIFKGYISNLRLTFEDGSIETAPNIAYLLNFLDSTQNEITFAIPSNKSITSIAYTVGTDSIVNVSGVYDGDLDPILGMYWAWNSGYINWKLEGTYGSRPFEFHIGGFTPPNATARLIHHNLAASNAQEFIISIDVAHFLEDATGEELPLVLMIPGSNSSKVANALSNNFSLNE